MHVNLWYPVTALSNNSAGRNILNAMWDLTQFVDSAIIMETNAEHLAKIFMDNSVILFGLVAILVVGTDRRFKSIFKDVCAVLVIIYCPLVSDNHKGMSVENHHRFLKKTQAIAVQDRVTYDFFIQNAKTSQYAWNNAPINGTYIIRTVNDVGQEFRFLLDFELLQTPTKMNQGNSDMYEYLWHVLNNSQFET